MTEAAAGSIQGFAESITTPLYEYREGQDGEEPEIRISWDQLTSLNTPEGLEILARTISAGTETRSREEILEFAETLQRAKTASPTDWDPEKLAKHMIQFGHELDKRQLRHAPRERSITEQPHSSSLPVGDFTPFTIPIR